MERLMTKKEKKRIRKRWEEIKKKRNINMEEIKNCDGKVKTLIEDDGKDYSGEFVATSSFNDKTVVASGKDPSEVVRQAEEKGYASPVVFFVFPKNTIHI